MKVQVFSDRDVRRGIDAKCIWAGELPVIPQKGSLLVIYDGWAAEEVKEIVYNLYDDKFVTILVSPDSQNEYPEIESDDKES